MTVVRTGVEWINNFHDDACNQNNLSYRATHAEGFQGSMSGHGHVAVFDWGDDNAWETDFRHPDFGGDSLNWSDNVHFCYFSEHGGNWDNIMHIAFAVAHEHCLAASNEWRLGSGMLKWLVMDCCQAVLGTSAAEVGGVWFGPMQGAHMVFGFVNDGHDAWWNRGLGSDFGDDAGGGARLANSWLDHAYSFWLGDAAIAIAAGVTQQDAINRRESETIDWRDWDAPSDNWLAWKWRS
jgi:uncharacterized protein DUF6345